MKKTTLFLLLIAAIQLLSAQTVLKPGDIAIVQVNYTFGSFDFVPLVDIAAGTQIKFTDYAWKNSPKGFDKSTNYDAVHTFTAASNIAKGTVIRSANNSMFDYSSVNFRSRNASNTYLKGENLISFQINGVDTTFLSAIGWMRKDNFSANPYNTLAKVCDVPPGLSKLDNTVIQLDSVTKPGTNPQLAQNFRYNKYDGFVGTAGRIRYFLSKTENYNNWIGDSNNDIVQNFTVSEPDVTPPSILYSYPTNNKLSTSIHGVGILKFNEPVIPQKNLIITNITKNQIVKTYTSADYETKEDSTIQFDLYPYLEKSASYTLTIPKDFVKDYDGNAWPSESTTYSFATSANKSTIECCFPDRSGIIINPYFSECEDKDDFHWTTLSRSVDEYNRDYCNGYFSWTMSGLPMKYYMNSLVSSNISIPDFPNYGIWSTNDGSRLVVDLSGITHNITDVISHVYDNGSAFFQRSYSGPNIMSEKSFSGFTGDRTGYIHFENDNGFKLDSVVFFGYEGRLISFKMEVIDKFQPVVELGNSKTICEGDSVQLDAGLTLGAIYNWNTGAKTQKIWVKTSGTYSVTVKNSLGQASDNIQVTVRPVITLAMPDTIYACVGDTVTLTAGTNTENSYFWSPGGQTTPSIKVTQSGIYHVLVNNGFGGCFNTDSTRVIFNGAKIRLFNYQGGSYGPGDVRGELYRKNAENKFVIYRDSAMLDFVEYSALPAGDYIFKMHFVNYSFVGENPWMDTYHDGKTEWKKVSSFHLTCQSDTMIGFPMANKPFFEFNGTAVISGKVQINGTPSGSPAMRIKAATTVDCDTKIMLYDGVGSLIATTCPDANGNFIFTNLPAGNYTVGIERTGFEVQQVFTTGVSAGETISNANFTVNEATQTVVPGLVAGVNKPVDASKLMLKVFPNPTVDIVNIQYSLLKNETITLSISDIAGKTLYAEKISAVSGINTHSLQVGFSKGLYFVKISNSTGSELNTLIIK